MPPAACCKPGKPPPAARPLDSLSVNSYPIGMRATVTQKGQVTIPKALRLRLGIRPGQILDFKEERGKLVARKVPRQDPVDSVYGILKLRKSTDELITELRGEVDTV